MFVYSGFFWNISNIWFVVFLYVEWESWLNILEEKRTWHLNVCNGDFATTDVIVPFPVYWMSLYIFIQLIQCRTNNNSRKKSKTRQAEESLYFSYFVSVKLHVGKFCFPIAYENMSYFWNDYDCDGSREYFLLFHH